MKRRAPRHPAYSAARELVELREQVRGALSCNRLSRRPVTNPWTTIPDPVALGAFSGYCGDRASFQR